MAGGMGMPPGMAGGLDPSLLLPHMDPSAPGGLDLDMLAQLAAAAQGQGGHGGHSPYGYAAEEGYGAY